MMKFKNWFGSLSCMFIMCTLVSSVSAQVNLECSQLVCIETVQSNKGVDFFGINKNAVLPVSLNLSHSSQNMEIAAGSGGAFKLAGKERKRLLSLRVKSSGQWRYNYRFHWGVGFYDAHHDANAIYVLPAKKNAKVAISQSCNGAFSHSGKDANAIDFDMKTGTPVHVARTGVVVEVVEKYSKGAPNRALRDKGNRVRVLHNDGTIASYFHLKKGGATVKVGAKVSAGTLIGYSGNTGFSSAPHLHLDVSRSTKDAKGTVSFPIQFSTAEGQVTCPPRGSRWTVN